MLAIAANHAVAAEPRRLFGIEEDAAVDVVTTATSMAGALWQMAAPHTGLRDLYRTDPALAHAMASSGRSA